MKNKEKYRDEIMNADRECRIGFCENFIKPLVLKDKHYSCGGTCSYCYARLALWLEEEYEEPISDDDVTWYKRYFNGHRGGVNYVDVSHV